MAATSHTGENFEMTSGIHVNLSTSGLEYRQKVIEHVIDLLDKLKYTKHKKGCQKNKQFSECPCIDEIFDDLITEFKKLPEKEIAYIFKTDITKCLSKKDEKIMFNKLALKFLDLCVDNKYIELARCILQEKLPQTDLKAYLTDKFPTLSDKLTALIITTMDNTTVQSFFYAEQGKLEENKINEMIKSRHEALISMLDKLEGQDKHGENVQNKCFEMDTQGSTPKNGTAYDFFCQTFYQKIVFEKIEDAVCHKSVHCLTNMKWEQWCRFAFTRNACIYLISVVLLIFVAAVSADSSDVRSYQSPIDYARAVFEIVLLINAARILGIEIYQIVRLGKGYLVDKMNIFEIIAPVLMLLVCPMRYIHEQAHWFIYTAAYMVWLLQIVKYALVFKCTGVYIDSLWQMIWVILKFAILVVISITIYSGAFLLVLKAENTLDLHKETRSFWRIFLVGLRVMIETDSIVEYIGDDGYNPVGVIFMMLFMFFMIVVLLNILIAQLINAYQTIENSSIKGFYVGRALIVARLEREHLPFIFNNDGKRRDCFEKALQVKGELPDSAEIWFEDQITLLRYFWQNRKDNSKSMKIIEQKFTN